MSRLSVDPLVALAAGDPDLPELDDQVLAEHEVSAHLVMRYVMFHASHWNPRRRTSDASKKGAADYLKIHRRHIDRPHKAALALGLIAEATAPKKGRRTPLTFPWFDEPAAAPWQHDTAPAATRQHQAAGTGHAPQHAPEHAPERAPLSVHKEEEEEESIDQRDDPRSRAVALNPETTTYECPLAGQTTTNNEADWKPHTDCHCSWIDQMFVEIEELWWPDGYQTQPPPPWDPGRAYRAPGGATLTHWTKKEIAGPLYRQAARLANGWEEADIFTQLAAYQDDYRAATNPVGLLISKLKQLNTKSPRTIAREEADQRIQRQMRQREEELRAIETGAFITDPQHIQRIREEEQQRLRLVNESA